MCCRYLLLQKHYREILEKLGIRGAAEFLSRYNITPGTDLPALRMASASGQPEMVALHWGFIPEWSQALAAATPLANARADSLTQKPSFREAFRLRRCVIPVGGFYEWQTVGREKRPYLFRRRDEAPFGLAGLWARSRTPDHAVRETCLVITTEPNELMHPIHHRMPALLRADRFLEWLDPSVTAPERLARFLQPVPAEAMSAVALSDYVNDARHDDPQCLTPAAASGVVADEPQLSLEL